MPSDRALDYALRKSIEVEQYTWMRRIRHELGRALGSFFPRRREEDVERPAAIDQSKLEFLHSLDLGDFVDSIAYPDGRHWLFDRTDVEGMRVVIVGRRIVEVRAAFRERGGGCQLVFRRLPSAPPEETIRTLPLYTKRDRERLIRLTGSRRT